MRPVYANTQPIGQEPPELVALRRDLLAAFQQLGDLAGAKDLGIFPVQTSETRIPHGLPNPPHVILYDMFAWTVQTRPADERFIYLQADVAATVGVLVF